MKIITINLPEKYLDAIQILNDFKVIPSRSEAIRRALEEFLKTELNFYFELNEDNFEKVVDEIMVKN